MKKAAFGAGEEASSSSNRKPKPHFLHARGRFEKPALRSVERLRSPQFGQMKMGIIRRVGAGRRLARRFAHLRPGNYGRMAVNGRPSWNVERPYDADAVERLGGTVQIEHTLARMGAERLRELLAGDGFVRA